LDILMKRNSQEPSILKKRCTGANTMGNEQGNHGQEISWNLARKLLYECGRRGYMKMWFSVA